MSAAGRRPVPRFCCPACGRLVAATTAEPYALVGGHLTYHRLRPHHRAVATPCPGRSVVHRPPAVPVPAGQPIPPTRGARP